MITLPPTPRPSFRLSVRTSTASSRSQWALPDLNRELQISVCTAGPQPRAPDLSGHCRTSTASSRSQWALQDLNRELQTRDPDLSQTPEKMSDKTPERMSECQSICQKEYQTKCQNKYAIYCSRWYVRNYVRIVCQDHSKKVL